jgi:hypothetical protein
MLGLLLLGCHVPAGPPRPELAFTAAARWSEGTLDAHHATVAFRGGDEVALAWTRGLLASDPTTWLTAIGADGLPVGPASSLRDGATSALPDIVAEASGALLVASESTGDGIWLERLGDRSIQLADEGAAGSKNAVDVASRPDGGSCAVWYDERDGVGRFHAAAADASLAPEVDRLPAVLAEVGPGASAAADVAADPDSGCAVTWNEQHANAPDVLWLQDFGPDGALRFEVALDDDGPETPPRRATVDIDTAGQRLVVWRVRGHEDWTTSSAWFAAVDSAGGWIAPPALLVDEVADDPVAALLGDDRFFASWATWDGAWTIRGALFAFPSGDLLAGPISLSPPGDPHRPHVAGRADGAVAVSWEAPDGDALAVFGVRIVAAR